ncbi:MAG: dephospho-CoA kinase [bacterium]|nr:dephospho-CoA kinase [bacterium]
MADKNKIPVIAITGGMGTGKTIVAEEFGNAGALIIEADTVSKEILWNDKKIQKKIIKAFGKTNICDKKGSIDKDKLIKAAFENTESVEKINSILHPAVREKINLLTEDGKKSGKYNLIAVEAALIFESGIQDKFDSIICVIAEDKVRFERLTARDGVSKEEIQKRINLQFDQAYNANRSDHVINNNGTVEELRTSAVEVVKIILQN